jgi:hypothetical protein
MQALQESGEFIVLNAGAYHSGYNQVRLRGCMTMIGICKPSVPVLDMQCIASNTGALAPA